MDFINLELTSDRFRRPRIISSRHHDLDTHCMELPNRRRRCLPDRVGYPNDSHRNTTNRNPDQTSCLLTEPVGSIGQFFPSTFAWSPAPVTETKSSTFL